MIVILLLKYFFSFLGNFHRYFRLCQLTYGQVAERYKWEKLAKSISWGIWPEPLQRVFDLDADASGRPSIYIPSAVHLKAYKPIRHSLKDRSTHTPKMATPRRRKAKMYKKKNVSWVVFEPQTCRKSSWRSSPLDYLRPKNLKMFDFQGFLRNVLYYSVWNNLF